MRKLGECYLLLFLGKVFVPKGGLVFRIYYYYYYFSLVIDVLLFFCFFFVFPCCFSKKVLNGPNKGKEGKGG